MQANIGWIKREGSCFHHLSQGTRVQARLNNGSTCIVAVGDIVYTALRHIIVAWRPVGAIKWPHVVKGN